MNKGTTTPYWHQDCRNEVSTSPPAAYAQPWGNSNCHLIQPISSGPKSRCFRDIHVDSILKFLTIGRIVRTVMSRSVSHPDRNLFPPCRACMCRTPYIISHRIKSSYSIILRPRYYISFWGYCNLSSGHGSHPS